MPALTASYQALPLGMASRIGIHADVMICRKRPSQCHTRLLIILSHGCGIRAPAFPPSHFRPPDLSCPYTHIPSHIPLRSLCALPCLCSGLTMAVGLSFEIDIQIASFAFIITGLLYRATHDWFENNLPKWGQFSQCLRDRMCAEIACIPVRIGLIYFTLPAVVTAFSPAQSWTAEYTRDALIAS